MQISGVPYKFTYVWGANAVSPQFITTPIPATSASPAASQQLGFPPATANPSGTPPNINDFNGAFNYFSLWALWVQGGSAVPWDSTFSTNNGGYPQSARLASALYPGVIWISLVDNNTTDPDTGGANWVQYPPHGEIYATGSGSFTVPVGVTRIYAEVWGAGGGSTGNNGGSAGGGGYAAGWIAVTPGQVITLSVGLGGTAGGGNGGSSSFGGFTATGGFGAGLGPGDGGTGSGGTINLTGQSGIDLTDGGTGFVAYTPGCVGNAPGGNAPRGGLGGNINQGGGSLPPTVPGGGGGSNSGTGGTYEQAGAGGAVHIIW